MVTIDDIVQDPYNAPKGMPIRCTRAACGTTVSPQWYWNYSTLNWYCEHCAKGINRAMNGELCKPISAKEMQG